VASLPSTDKLAYHQQLLLPLYQEDKNPLLCHENIVMQLQAMTAHMSSARNSFQDKIITVLNN
jgi:hypothetical protein